MGGDPWLNSLDDGYSHSELAHDLLNQPVSCLFAPGIRRWDYDLVNDLFSVQEAQIILRTPLSNRVIADSWYWICSDNGLFSVKSCYRLLVGECQLQAHPVWQRLWKIKVQAKIHNFLWHCAWDCVPTREVLRSKNVHSYGGCPLCDHNSETLYHLLFLCPVALDYWRLAKLQIGPLVQESVNDSLLAIFNYLSSTDAELFSSICYNLWLNRNRKVWKDYSSSAQHILNLAGQ